MNSHRAPRASKPFFRSLTDRLRSCGDAVHIMHIYVPASPMPKKLGFEGCVVNERVERYLTAIRAGSTLAHIGAAEGITKQAVSLFLFKHGISERADIKQKRESLLFPKLVTAYQTGSPISDIAREFRVSDKSVSRALGQAGISPDKYRRPRKFVSRIEARKSRYSEWLVDGKKPAEIARMDGLSLQAVIHFIRKHIARPLHWDDQKWLESRGVDKYQSDAGTPQGRRLDKLATKFLQAHAGKPAR